MSDMLWLQEFVDERIRLSHKETSAAPNTIHSGVVIDRFGHVVNTGAGGGSLPFLLRYNGFGDSSIASNTEERLRFDTLVEDEGGYVTTGASWIFEPPSDGWYATTIYIKWAPSGGDIAAGGNFDMTWWRGTTQEDEIYKWQASQTVPSGTPASFFVRPVLYFQASYDINFRIDNDIGQALLLSDGYIAIEQVGNPPA